MKTKHFYLLLLFVALGLSACEDEDERFYLYELSEVYDPNVAVGSVCFSIVSGTTVGVSGGEAPYTASVADEQVVRATVREEGDLINLSPVKLGSTTLTVRDARGEEVRIGVEVVTGRKGFSVRGVSVEVTGDLDEAARTELENDALSTAVAQEGGAFSFTYTDKDSGTFGVVSSSDEESATRLSGEFTEAWEQSGDRSLLFVNCVLDNGEGHAYYWDDPNRRTRPESANVRDLGPQDACLVEDLTSRYQGELPQGVTVSLVYSGYLVR